MTNHMPISRVVFEKFRKEISSQASSRPVVQEDTSKVLDISLPSHSGRIASASTDDDSESSSELAQCVAVGTSSQRVVIAGGLHDNLIGTYFRESLLTRSLMNKI